MFENFLSSPCSTVNDEVMIVAQQPRVKDAIDIPLRVRATTNV